MRCNVHHFSSVRSRSDHVTWSLINRAPCYVTMLEVSGAVGQIPSRGQRCWKNFPLWRKQTALWPCSLLSGCINRPLTSLCVTLLPLSLKHILAAAAVQIHTNYSWLCREGTQTNAFARIRVKSPSCSLRKKKRFRCRAIRSHRTPEACCFFVCFFVFSTIYLFSF